MQADLNFQGQAKRIVEQMDTMMIDTNVQEQAKVFGKHMEAMMANPNLQRQAKLFAEQLETMIANLWEVSDPNTFSQIKIWRSCTPPNDLILT